MIALTLTPSGSGRVLRRRIAYPQRPAVSREADGQQAAEAWKQTSDRSSRLSMRGTRGAVGSVAAAPRHSESLRRGLRRCPGFLRLAP